jgi:hypothetical protein
MAISLHPLKDIPYINGIQEFAAGNQVRAGYYSLEPGVRSLAALHP